MNLIKVDSDNYFTDTGHMSTSKFKRFIQCERLGLTNYEKPSEAMLFGSIIDAHVEGTLEEFKEEHPELYSTRGKTKGKLKATYRQADEICNFIDNDSNIQDFLSGKKQVIMEGEIAEVPYKIMIDSYSKGIAISDLKCMRTITNRQGEYYDFITHWGYEIQGAIYQEIVRQNTGEQLPFFIVVVTKEKPVNSAIVNIDQGTLDVVLQKVKEKSPRFYDIWRGLEVPIGCGKCKACIANRKSTPIISLEELQLEGGE